MKFKINKEEFDKLSDEMKALYKTDGEGYKLQVEGLEGTEDVGELKRAKDHEKEARKQAETQLAELKKTIAELDDDSSRQKGDVEALEASWKQKNETLKAELEAKIATKDGFIKTTLVDNVANQLANEISTSPALILPHIVKRLTADFDGDTPLTKVLDNNGQPSALSLDELKKELVDNKDFKSIIVGSNASGSGTSKTGRQISSSGADGKPINLAAIDPKELSAIIQSKNNQE